MIVTICGAYRNAGDHLIGHRARELLRVHGFADIVTVDRKSIGPEHYDLFNKARAVLLCGGPAYQRGIYPTIYPLERERVTPPIVPYGLGWKWPATKDPETFQFTDEAAAFVSDIHQKIEFSSARDPLTVECLARFGVANVLMTGCPAWYDLESLEKPYAFRDDVRSIVLSMPAKMQPGTYELMAWLTKRFPKARRTLSFHHGLLPSWTPRGREIARDYLMFAGRAILNGWRVESLAESLPKLEALYGDSDLHIGYRVHAHLFCLSRRVSSILISEDSRGVGQAAALGATCLTIDRGTLSPIQNAVEAHFKSRGAEVAHSVETMRETYPTMQRFLATL
ncbi:hypothetical protein AUC69_12450 [Methyloceanibacter superfactus]|uniref:Polysaccharide pyruvyl transferase domain-containing protein n=1 Tax=Methyloceanibacter superfactus TaxID=1774969 RepID=A0A1E3VV54_9HYPH|nr:polysaccharide pyruvyl transferase family protein [Methyloceanibacter superfactus]ODR97414.1 hypothetical protein AUC69_12450 [Methyloceanibacter superfactus]